MILYDSEKLGEIIKFIIAICTRNRPSELKHCIDNILKIEFKKIPIIIVDSSDTFNYDISEIEDPKLNLIYLKSHPGLTRQRNIAIDNARSVYDWIIFLDDDVIVGKSFVKDFISNVNMYSNAIGFGALSNDSNRTFIKSRGKVTRSGLNVQHGFTCNGTFETDWIPGYCFAVNLRSMGKLEFDQNRNGYSMGEDVDFSLKLRSLGTLYISNELPILHCKSPTNRYTNKKMNITKFCSRVLLANDHPIYIKKRIVFSRLALEIFLDLFLEYIFFVERFRGRTSANIFFLRNKLWQFENSKKYMSSLHE